MVARLLVHQRCRLVEAVVHVHVVASHLGDEVHELQNYHLATTRIEKISGIFFTSVTVIRHNNEYNGFKRRACITRAVIRLVKLDSEAHK